MVVIVVHVGKNMVDDVLLDGGSRVNAITYGLRKNLGLPPPNQLHSTYNWLISHSTNHHELFPILGLEFMAYHT